jgi:asparagine synthase (glutamine-hydrolysing)
MHLYRAFGSSFVPKLDGMFAFVLVDQVNGTFLAARDHVGIKPLYMGKSDGKLMFASELKCLVDVCDEISEIPNGTYYTPEEGFVKYYNPAFLEAGYEPRQPIWVASTRLVPHHGQQLACCLRTL